MNQIIFTPLIEDGKHAVRPPKTGEWLDRCNGEMLHATGDYTFDHAIYTREEREVAPEAEAEGTPNEWKYTSARNRHFIIYTNDGGIIAELHDEKRAALIVRAVNGRAQLVDLIIKMRNYIASSQCYADPPCLVDKDYVCPHCKIVAEARRALDAAGRTA